LEDIQAEIEFLEEALAAIEKKAKAVSSSVLIDDVPAVPELDAESLALVRVYAPRLMQLKAILKVFGPASEFASALRLNEALALAPSAVAILKALLCHGPGSALRESRYQINLFTPLGLVRQGLGQARDLGALFGYEDPAQDAVIDFLDVILSPGFDPAR
jgi:hypothetical protein